MLTCNLCQKGVQTVAFSRHKKGSSGAGGTWALRAPITKHLQRPNLHNFKGLKFCTKCLRVVKSAAQESSKKVVVKPVEKVSEQPQAQV